MATAVVTHTHRKFDATKFGRIKMSQSVQTMDIRAKNKHTPVCVYNSLSGASACACVCAYIKYQSA